MKKLLAIIFTVILGGACLCGNAVISKDTTYCDDGIMPLAATSVKVEYESKTEDKFNMVLKYPNYTISPYLAACACVAGSNIIGFYDRYDEELIPNHNSGTAFMGNYIYSSDDGYIEDLVRQLYADMGTTSEGTTVTEFKNGMIKFCNRKGKTITFTSCMKNKKFDYATAKSYMEANQPIALFCSGYNVADIFTSEKRDSIDYIESTANHVMVGFGWKEVNYNITATSSVLYQYVAVASGNADKSNGYYNINYNTTINDAYAINIY
ncbi:MAG: hypothetical protein HDP28_01345 [Clostridia bacterium]|nr:hypothetical protein [Clostridia bacterium]